MYPLYVLSLLPRSTQADINAKGMYGNSALMKAAYWGMFDVAKYLQCMGADKEQTNDDGLTALHLAAQVSYYTLFISLRSIINIVISLCNLTISRLYNPMSSCPIYLVVRMVGMKW